ncbi:hypothetical protein D8S78_10595 [Natrialba swarupiae]|nr:hypothetical protein [Natrialba swarupiae]
MFREPPTENVTSLLPALLTFSAFEDVESNEIASISADSSPTFRTVNTTSLWSSPVVHGEPTTSRLLGSSSSPLSSSPSSPLSSSPSSPLPSSPLSPSSPSSPSSSSSMTSNDTSARASSMPRVSAAPTDTVYVSPTSSPLVSTSIESSAYDISFPPPDGSINSTLSLSEPSEGGSVISTVSPWGSPRGPSRLRAQRRRGGRPDHSDRRDCRVRL